ncbi:MAG: hypothetical protein K9G36_05150 [Crocinitomicaceae bacterium]|nr:hypothetical protein [Crocinitomicaceae bacterium]
MKWLLFVFFIGFYFNPFFSQRNVKDSAIATPWIGVHYGGNFTAGDLADRYGYLNHLGIIAGYKTATNWYIGMESNFIFGNQVRVTGLLNDLIDSYGNVTDVNGDIARIFVLPRGLNINVSVGKVFPVLSPNNNSGIFVNGGLGYLIHHMRIETNDQVVPQLELNYRKGYDRLTSGVNLHQFIGYAFMANSGFYNFYGGFYAQEGFTKNLRTINLDEPEVPVSSKTRIDIQVGFRLGWMIPFYKRKPKDFYFN